MEGLIGWLFRLKGQTEWSNIVIFEDDRDRLSPFFVHDSPFELLAIYTGGIDIDDPTEIYDPEYGDDRECVCGHPYHRHFDSYENMSDVGCKYCGCRPFKNGEETDD